MCINCVFSRPLTCFKFRLNAGCHKFVTLAFGIIDHGSLFLQFLSGKHGKYYQNSIVELWPYIVLTAVCVLHITVLETAWLRLLNVIKLF